MTFKRKDAIEAIFLTEENLLFDTTEDSHNQ